jgi:hypothetical protein
MKILALLLLTTCLLAGEQGILRGEAVDQITKESIPGVNVLVDSTGYGTCTDANGKYEIELPAGIYALTYTMLGYQRCRLVDVVITADSISSQNVQLLPAPIPAEEVVLAVPGAKSSFPQKNRPPSGLKLKIIKPDASIDYKIIQVVPDSTVDYKIIIIGAE